MPSSDACEQLLAPFQPGSYAFKPTSFDQTSVNDGTVDPIKQEGLWPAGQSVIVTTEDGKWRSPVQMGQELALGELSTRLYIDSALCPGCRKSVGIASRHNTFRHNTFVEHHRPLKTSLKANGGVYHVDGDCNETDGFFMDLGKLRRNGLGDNEWVDGELIGVMSGQTHRGYNKVFPVVYDCVKEILRPGCPGKDNEAVRVL